MTFFRKCINWLKRFFLWFWEMKKVWLCLSVMLIVTALVLYLSPDDQGFRIGGYLLEMAGVALTFKGLLELGRHFGVSFGPKVMIDWLKRFPRWRRVIKFNLGPATTECSAGSLRMETWSPDDPELPVEERIKKILRNIDTIRADIGSAHTRIDGVEQDHKSLSKNLHEKVDGLEDKVEKRFEDIHVSGIGQTYIGLVWLAVGLTYGTLSEELACLVLWVSGSI